MRFAVLFAAVVLLSACSNAGGPKPIETASGPSTATQRGPAPEKSAAAPGTGAPSQEAPDQPLDEKVADARAAYEKNPGDAAAKKTLVDVTLQNSQFYMYKSPLPPNQKYPKALRGYREVLKLDPSNAQASESIALLESIYHQMGKPVPEA